MEGVAIDVRLCALYDSLCITSLVPDFTVNDGPCAPTPTSNSTLTSISADGTTALFEAFSDIGCTVPTLSLHLVLDGTPHAAPAAGLTYVAARHGACRPPDPFSPSFLSYSDSTGRRSGDAGNMDVCLAAHNSYCIVQDTASGFFTGVCLPSECGVADVTNTSSPIWGFIAAQAPLWLAVTLGDANSTLRLAAFCGTQEYAWGDGATRTVAALVTVGALVVCATLYALVVARSTVATVAAAKFGGKSSTLTGDVDALLRASSLTTTVPRLFGASPPARARDETAPRLAAFDGLRVLSLSLVVLGHSFFFPLSLTGFTNGVGIYKNLGDAAFQVIPSAEFAVDSFFALSGALGAFLFSKGLIKAFKAIVAAENAATAARSSNAAALLSSVNDDSANEDEEADEDGNDVGYSRAPRTPGIVAARIVARAGVATVGAWAYATLHRYLRLVPSVGVMIVVFIYLGPLMGSGPFWMNGWSSTIDSCTDHAWADLVFLNNFLPGQHDGLFGRQCAGWLWYLAVDMQLHVTIIAPLCAAFAAFAPLGWICLAGVLAGTIAQSAHVVTSQSLTFMTAVSDPQFTGDSSDSFYDKPIERAPAFLIGIGLGWALLTWEARNIAAANKRREDETALIAGDDPAPATSAAYATSSPAPSMEGNEGGACISPVLAACGLSSSILSRRLPGCGDDTSASAATAAAAHTLCLAVLPTSADGKRINAGASVVMCAALALLGVLFYIPTSAYQGGLGRAQLAFEGTPTWTATSQQAFMVASRPAWALGLCVILYLCATRRGGVLERALSHSFWRPIALLSFGAYLYHPVILYVLNLSVGSTPRYTPAFLATTFAATAVFACLAAGVMYVLVEAPAAALEKVVVDRMLRAAAFALTAALRVMKPQRQGVRT